MALAVNRRLAVAGGSNRLLNEVILIVVLYMVPTGDPSVPPYIMQRMPEPNMEECWKDAHEFANRDLSDVMRHNGAIGLGAQCSWRYPLNNIPDREP